MLRIRFSRVGRKKIPRYRLVVAERSKKLKGQFVEVLGWYNPTGKKDFSVNKERIEEWLAKGAQPSNSVARLLNRAGFGLEVRQKPPRPKKKAKKEGVKEQSKVEASSTEEKKEEDKTTGEVSPEEVKEGKPEEETREKEAPLESKVKGAKLPPSNEEIKETPPSLSSKDKEKAEE